MKVTLKLTYDDKNTYPTDDMIFESSSEIDTIYITLGDREVGVLKSELVKMVKLLGDEQ